MMEKSAPNIVPSGIEPVDKLLGGLESGQLYLVRGESSGKSLFGIKFLIEGLKRGENGALVIRYSPEDAVRRFARLGYDCLEDVYSGRLVILEYSDDIIQQISRLRELTPVLRELEWLLGETRPQRLVFDPATSLVISNEGNVESRVREFVEWASSFGATVVLVANGDNEEIVRNFNLLVADTFRFEVRETGDKAIRFLAFEKSPAIADQAIEVDPSRGVFLLGRPQPLPVAPDETLLPAQSEFLREAKSDATTAPLPSPIIGAETASSRHSVEQDLSDILEPLADLPLIDEASAEPPRRDQPDYLDLESGAIDVSSEETMRQPEQPDERGTVKPTTTLVKSLDTTLLKPLAEIASERADLRLGEEASFTERAEQADDLSALFDELSGAASPLDLDIPELEPVQSQPEDTEEKISEQAPAYAQQTIDEVTPGPTHQRWVPRGEPSGSRERQAPSAAREQPPAAELLKASGPEEPPLVSRSPEAETQSRKRSRASDQKIDSAIAARAVEILLRPPELSTEPPLPSQLSRLPAKARPVLQPEPTPTATANPKDFNVLIIDDDPASCELVAQALGEYTVEVVHDGVSGLAKLISLKPDLVVLDVDLPIVDGFKVLAHIRSSLNMPIIIVSGTRVRASDRVLSAELGADYFLTKPFSVKELQQKTRQLIARYRGINSWIVTAPLVRGEQAEQSESRSGLGRVLEPVVMSIESGGDQFTPYEEFAADVERRVRTAMDNGSAFSIVGCRLPSMTANAGRVALRLFEMASTLVRDTDLISTNPRNDLVIMLADADATGARAFIGRLRERVFVEMNQEPSVWLRSFPELEEATETTPPSQKSNNGHRNRRASDNPDDGLRVEFKYPPEPARSSEQATETAKAQEDKPKKPDPRKSYIDFLEHL